MHNLCVIKGTQLVWEVLHIIVQKYYNLIAQLVCNHSCTICVDKLHTIVHLIETHLLCSYVAHQLHTFY